MEEESKLLIQNHKQLTLDVKKSREEQEKLLNKQEAAWQKNSHKLN
jgi:hypothetical protein